MVSQYAKKFETLSFSACRNISKDLLTQLCINCSSLKKLDLSGLNEIIDDDLIEYLAVSASNLRFFDIKGCTKVTDNSICLLSNKCIRIEMLCLAGINSLTDKCIFSIANNLNQSLKEIYLSGCNKITQQSLRYLVDCCVNYLYFEHRVPNQDRNQLMAKNLDTGYFERVDTL